MSQEDIIHRFIAACGVPGCWNQSICLPGTLADPKRQRDRVDLNAYKDWRGYWNYTGAYKLFIPSRLGLFAALRRHHHAAKAPWYPVCVRCIALSYVRSGNTRFNDGHHTKFTMFGVAATHELIRIRRLKDPEQALDELLYKLHHEVLRDLCWSTLPRKKQHEAIIEMLSHKWHARLS